MPPSKKTQDKQKAKVVEDKTFGLKNKNRSTKVQNYVSSVQQNVKNSNPNDRKAQAANEDRKKAKEDKRAFEEAMAKLMGGQHGGGAAAPKKGDGEEGEEGEDGEENKNLGVAPDEYLWTADDFDAVETDESRLEEKLEAEREALQGRTDLTPVTEETFQAWKTKKREEAAAAEVLRLKKAKAAGAGLRGWDLWQHDQTLFVDDDDADAEYYEAEDEEQEEEGGEGGSGGGEDK